MALATVDYRVQVDHDGRKYQIHVPSLSVPRCGACGEIAIDEVADQAIQGAFRKEANLLTPEEIRSGRQQLGYNQQEFADSLGVAVSTVSRWENGVQVQQRFHNDVMRAFFEVPAFRLYLDNLHRVQPSNARPDRATPAVNVAAPDTQRVGADGA